MTDESIIKVLRKNKISESTIETYKAENTTDKWGYRCYLKEVLGFDDLFASFLIETLNKTDIDRTFFAKVPYPLLVNKYKDFLMYFDRHHLLLAIKIISYKGGGGIIKSMKTFVNEKSITIVDLFIIVEYVSFILYSEFFVTEDLGFLYDTCYYFKFFVDKTKYLYTHMEPPSELIYEHLDIFDRFYRYQKKTADVIPEELHDAVINQIKRGADILRNKQGKKNMTIEEIIMRFEKYIESEEELTLKDYYNKYFPEFNYLSDMGKLMSTKNIKQVRDAKKKSKAMKEKQLEQHEIELSKMNQIIKNNPEINLLDFMRLIPPETRDLDAMSYFLNGSKKEYPALNRFFNRFFEIEQRTSFNTVFKEKAIVKGVEITPEIRDIVIQEMTDNKFPKYYILYSLMLREHINTMIENN